MLRLAVALILAACAATRPDPARELAFHHARLCADRAPFIGVRPDAHGDPEFYFTHDRQASGALLASAQECYQKAMTTVHKAGRPTAATPGGAGEAAAAQPAASRPAPDVATGGAPAAAGPTPAPPTSPPGPAPVIALASPADGAEVVAEEVLLVGAAAGPRGVSRVTISLNGRVVRDLGPRAPSGGEPEPAVAAAETVDFAARLTLAPGGNRIAVTATDARGLSSTRTVTVTLLTERGTVWAAVIGISRYRNAIPSLKYADRDALAVRDYLTAHLGVPGDQLIVLVNEQATLTALKRVLGTELRRQAGPRDTVLIYFAGHGAPEADASRADDDGLEKYLVPHDADPADLYTTALPMREVEAILGRLASERVVFIADTCYSGATTGRTFGTAGRRAIISEAFLARLARGRGRVVLTASRPTEVSEERDALRHGVFTYYLLEGLRGAADADGDGAITVDEAYAYVSRTVPPATGQGQHPQKKGEVEGQIVLGRVEPRR